MGLNLDNFNQRIKVHDHLANLVLHFLQQHHATLTPFTQTDDMVKKYNDLNRAHELLQAQYSASLRASTSTSPTVASQKDDAELVTPPPVNHTHNPRHLPAPSLRPAQQPLMASRLMARRNPGSFSLFTEFLHHLPSRRRHNCSPCTAHRMTSSSTTHGPAISHACISSNRPQPPLWRHWSSGPPITRPVSTNKSLDFMATQLLQARQRMRRTYTGGDGGFVGTGARLLTEKALSHLIVTARLLSG